MAPFQPTRSACHRAKSEAISGRNRALPGSRRWWGKVKIVPIVKIPNSISKKRHQEEKVCVSSGAWWTQNIDEWRKKRRRRCWWRGTCDSEIYILKGAAAAWEISCECVWSEWVKEWYFCLVQRREAAKQQPSAAKCTSSTANEGTTNGTRWWPATSLWWVAFRGNLVCYFTRKTHNKRFCYGLMAKTENLPENLILFVISQILLK